ncbi:MAG: hypothetical protein WBF73_32995 [Bradyrhizobium sp.]
MQPTYITATSSGSSPWKVANWHATGPQQFGFAVLSTGGSNWQIDVAMEDPTNVYPSPNSSLPTAFPLITASSTTAANQITGLTSLAIAAYRLTVNVLSSVGAKVTLATVQAGIG